MLRIKDAHFSKTLLYLFFIWNFLAIMQVSKGSLMMTTYPNYAGLFPRASEYIPFSPVTIDGDDAFTAFANASMWPGNGTQESPYLIENLNISTSVQGEHAFSLSRTTKFFIIRHCLFTAKGSEIPLNYPCGIYFSSVFNGIIEDTIAQDCTRCGFFFAGCQNLTVRNNTAARNNWGIQTYSSSYINYSYNSVLNNYGEGFYGTANHCLFFGNFVRYASRGISLAPDASNNLVIHNTIQDCGNGILMGSKSNHNIIANNTFFANSYPVIEISSYGDYNNSIKYNNIIAKTGVETHQAQADSGNNYFDFNYWSVYTSPDTNFDGFVDSPYNIDGQAGLIDPHPVTQPYPISIPYINTTISTIPLENSTITNPFEVNINGMNVPQVLTIIVITIGVLITIKKRR